MFFSWWDTEFCRVNVLYKHRRLKLPRLLFELTHKSKLKLKIIRLLSHHTNPTLDTLLVIMYNIWWKLSKQHSRKRTALLRSTNEVFPKPRLNSHTYSVFTHSRKRTFSFKSGHRPSLWGLTITFSFVRKGTLKRNWALITLKDAHKHL